jgi:hypothetical protein
VTEVPEHLLERSRARRAALGQGGDAPEPSGEATPATTGGGAPAKAEAAAAPAKAPAAPPPPPVPAFTPPPRELIERVETVRRQGIPLWVMPALVLMPFWGILYFGAFGERGHEELTPEQLGAQVYVEAGCAACHGQRGEGASGPALGRGESVKTFPDEAAHIEWVETGSQGKNGQPYGDPAREGGQRTVQQGAMPAFAGQLSPAEIQAVVLYEREGL